MSNGTGGEGSDGMQDSEGRTLDRKQWIIIALGVALVILVGLVVGYIVSGGLSADPVAAPPTTAPSAGSVSSTTSPATTQPPTSQIPGQLSVPAVEDTYVNEGEPESVNGLEDALEIENDPLEVKRALIRFEVPGVPEGETIRSVTMRLFVLADSEETITIHSVGGPWSQNETNGTNAPAVGAQLATIPPGTPEGSEVEVDLTSVVTGSGTYDFYLTTPTDDSGEFASIESGTNPPLLILDWGSGEAAGGAVTELSGNPVVLAGAGDIADCALEGDSVTAELLGQVIQEHPEAIVFTTGDNAYPGGSAADFAECYAPTWGQFKDRTRPSVGNHEYDDSGAGGYFGYFGQAAGVPGEGYYSYEAGDWQVLVLNSNCDQVGGCETGSAQEEWLREELSASDAHCTLAYWHDPLFSSGDHAGEDSVRPLFQALYEDGAEVVINGHVHNFERFAPQNADGIHDPVGGIRQFVAGTGGKTLTSFEATVANSESRFSETVGILKLALYTDGYEWEFVSEGGSDFHDVGIEACH